jgi:alpha-amylase
VFLPRNTNINFKFIKKDGSNNVTWEGGANNVFTVPNTATATTTDSWR